VPGRIRQQIALPLQTWTARALNGIGNLRLRLKSRATCFQSTASPSTSSKPATGCAWSSR
jgi:hypothetical protein